MAATCAYIRALTLTHTEVDRILALVNRRLVEDIADDHFVTLLLARLDCRTCSLVYSSAGHSPGYVLDGEGKVKTVLSSTGMPLGVNSAVTFPSAAVIPLDPGDLVLLLTDGVVETFSADGTSFGLGRVLDAVRPHRHEPPHSIVEGLLHTVRAFSGDRQFDDQTAVLLKVAMSSCPHGNSCP